MIRVGQNAKENDTITKLASPKDWWIHVSGFSGAHVISSSEEEPGLDAFMLAVHHSGVPKTLKMVRVSYVRVEQVIQMRAAGQVKLIGNVKERTVHVHKESDRLGRLIDLRKKIIPHLL